ncbi:MAG: 5'-methylthioadenosine phosphorylase [Clostridiaceae bacterium BRH_c20a]|nr:MAG: 5'-methylthioadenosine phosphorylase [Clostridiaceae bacterium BRH_c20a]
MQAEFAVIGGTGVYNPRMLTDIQELTVDTQYGAVPLKIGKLENKKVAFLARHGSKHSVPPHQINYRANIMALKKIGVKKIIATAAVGSLNEKMAPGQLVVLDQFIDFTKSRVQTFYEGSDKGVLHVDMTNPYCPELAQKIIDICPPSIYLHQKGTYVCTEGPRFETPAEIKMFKMWGCDLVGMTSVPEVVLARELGMCYGSIAMITNYAAGISALPLTHREVVETMSLNTHNLQALIMEVLSKLNSTQQCFCSGANLEAGNLG